MDLALQGKRVIVTGGSKGIGRSITEAFLKEGARVAICARDEATLAIAAAELSELGEVHYHTADLSTASAAEEFVNWAAAELGGLDVLVSNVSAIDRKSVV